MQASYLAAVARRRSVVLAGGAVVADGAAAGTRSPGTAAGQLRTSRVVDGRRHDGAGDVQVGGLQEAAAQVNVALQVLAICTADSDIQSNRTVR